MYFTIHTRNQEAILGITDLIKLYNLQDKITPDGWLYYKIRQAIYGLKEAGKLANIQLQKVLATKGYYPCQIPQYIY